MGRGDIKTKKGKTFAGSFGKIRSAKVAKKSAVSNAAADGTEVAKEAASKKAAPKKAAAPKEAK